MLKHGVKTSGMPAWGPSMDDKYLWDMVMEGHDERGRSSFEPPDDPMASPNEEEHVDAGHAH